MASIIKAVAAIIYRENAQHVIVQTKKKQRLGLPYLQTVMMVMITAHNSIYSSHEHKSIELAHLMHLMPANGV